MAPLDPWIIEEILKREREKKRQEEEERREQPTVPADDPREIPDRRDDRGSGSDSGREMPADRKPGYEMPNPNEPARAPQEKQEDDGQRRGVDISRISGGDDEDEGDGPITIDISKIPPAFPEEGGKKEEKRPE